MRRQSMSRGRPSITVRTLRMATSRLQQVPITADTQQAALRPQLRLPLIRARTLPTWRL
jgi:hypothetical protein